MGFIFAELNELSFSERVGMYQSDKQSLDEILLYYLCDICPAKNYNELKHVVETIEDNNIRDKMRELVSDPEASDIKIDTCYNYSITEGSNIVKLYEVRPPVHRLGGLYSSQKLADVLTGIRTNVALPPVKLRHGGGNNFKYEVIDGIHRYYASIRLGYGSLPAVICG